MPSGEVRRSAVAERECGCEKRHGRGDGGSPNRWRRRRHEPERKQDPEGSEDPDRVCIPERLGQQILLELVVVSRAQEVAGERVHEQPGDRGVRGRYEEAAFRRALQAI